MGWTVRRNELNLTGRVIHPAAGATIIMMEMDLEAGRGRKETGGGGRQAGVGGGVCLGEGAVVMRRRREKSGDAK